MNARNAARWLALFILTFVAANLAAQNGNSGAPVALTDPEGVLDDGSGDAPYAPNLDKGYLLAPDAAEFLILTFEDFRLAEPSGGSAGDFLEIYDGPDASAPLLGRHAGFGLPYQIKSSGPEVFLRFVTDDAGEAPGWRLHYEGVNIEPIPEYQPIPENRGLLMPGDADNDGEVTQRDVDLILAAAGATGPARENRGTDFTGYEPPEFWAGSFDVDGVEINHRYGDANGDGTIDADDAAIARRHKGRSIMRGDAVISPLVEIIDSTQLYIVSTREELENDLWRFRKLRPYENDFAEGDIITGPQGMGFLRKIVAIDDREREIVFKTEQATIPDLFLKGGFILSGNLEDPREITAPGKGNGHIAQTTSESKVVKSADGFASLEVGYDIDFEPDWVFMVEVDYWEPGFDLKLPRGIKQLRAGLERSLVESSLYYELEVGGEAKFDYKKRIPKLSFGRKIPIPQFPWLIVSVDVDFFLQVLGETQGKINGRYEYTREDYVSAYIDCPNGNCGTKYDHSTNERIEQTLELEAGGFLEVAVYPELSIMIQESLGPYFQLRPALKATAEVEGRKEFISEEEEYYWQIGLDGRIDFIMGAELELFGFNLASFGPISFNLASKSFYKAPYWVSYLDFWQNQQPGLGNVSAQVQDMYGNSVPFVPVYFEIESGGGTIGPLNKKKYVSFTNRDGIATADWKLSDKTTEVQELVAYVLVPPSPGKYLNQELFFERRNKEAVEAAEGIEDLTFQYGNCSGKHYGEKGKELVTDVCLKVYNRDSKEFEPGVEVRFRPLDGHGTVSERIVITDENGIASTKWTLGHDDEVQYLVAGFNAEPEGRESKTIRFEAKTNFTPSIPVKAEILSGNTQLLNELYEPTEDPVIVRLLDASNKPVPDYEVIVQNTVYKTDQKGTVAFFPIRYSRGLSVRDIVERNDEEGYVIYVWDLVKDGKKEQRGANFTELPILIKSETDAPVLEKKSGIVIYCSIRDIDVRADGIQFTIWLFNGRYTPISSDNSFQIFTNASSRNNLIYSGKATDQDSDESGINYSFFVPFKDFPDYPNTYIHNDEGEIYFLMKSSPARCGNSTKYTSISIPEVFIPDCSVEREAGHYAQFPNIEFHERYSGNINRLAIAVRQRRFREMEVFISDPRIGNTWTKIKEFETEYDYSSFDLNEYFINNLDQGIDYRFRFRFRCENGQTTGYYYYNYTLEEKCEISIENVDGVRGLEEEGAIDAHFILVPKCNSLGEIGNVSIYYYNPDDTTDYPAEPQIKGRIDDVGESVGTGYNGYRVTLKDAKPKTTYLVRATFDCSLCNSGKSTLYERVNSDILVHITGLPEYNDWCEAPLQKKVFVNRKTSYSARIHWPATKNAKSYLLRYYETGRPNKFWSDTLVRQPDAAGYIRHNLTGLKPETSYGVDIHSICEWDLSEPAYAPFTTQPKGVSTFTCPRPDTVIATYKGDGEMEVSWQIGNELPNTLDTEYHLSWRKINDTEAEGETTILPEELDYAASDQFRTVTGLDPGETYAFRLEPICLERTQNIRTPLMPLYTIVDTRFEDPPAGCDPPPPGAFQRATLPSDVRTDRLTLRWEEPHSAGANAYAVEYREVGAAVFNEATTVFTAYSFSQLTPGVEYEIRVSSICGGERSAAYIDTFITAPVCASAPEWDLSGIIGKGNEIELAWLAGETPAERYYVEWQSPEMDFPRGAETAGLEYTITGLTPLETYDITLYSLCGDSRVPSLEVSVFAGGEIECLAPELTEAFTTAREAALFWRLPNDASDRGLRGYEVQYQLAGAGDQWNSAGQTGDSYLKLTGLVPGVNYRARVRALCPGSEVSGYSAPFAFETGSEGAGTCNTPVATGHVPRTNGATLTWTPVAGAVRYEVEYAERGVWNFRQAVATTGTSELTGLETGKQYVAKISAVCATGPSGFDLYPFTLFEPPATSCVEITAETEQNYGCYKTIWGLKYEINVAGLPDENAPWTLTFDAGGMQTFSGTGNGKFEVDFELNTDLGFVEQPIRLLSLFSDQCGYQALNQTIIWQATLDDYLPGSGVWPPSTENSSDGRISYTITGSPICPVVTLINLTLNIEYYSSGITGVFENLSAGDYLFYYSDPCRAVCDWEDYSTLEPRNTKACDKEVVIATAETAPGFIRLAWEDNNADRYETRYREQGSDTWQDGPATTELTAEFSNLLCGRDYEFAVRSVCADGRFGPFTPYPGALRVPPAPAPPAWYKPGVRAYDDYITLLWRQGETPPELYYVEWKSDDMSEPQGMETASLNYFIEDLAPGTEYDITVYAVCDGARIAGLDTNLTTTGSDPCAALNPQPTYQAYPASCDDCANGILLVQPGPPGRYLYALNCEAPGVAPFFTNLLPGTYDVCITETNSGCKFQLDNMVLPSAGPDPCEAPVNSAITSLTQTEMTLAWSSASPDDEYMVYYRQQSMAASWTAVLVQNATSITLVNLERGATYEYMIRSRCNGQLSEDRLRGDFQTPDLPGACNGPEIQNVAAQARQALVQWTPDPGAASYTLSYSDAPEAHWQNLHLPDPATTSYLLQDLRPNTLYHARIRGNCWPGVSGWSEQMFITAPASRLQSEQTPAAAPPQLYPNPASGQFYLSFGPDWSGETRITMLDARGAVVRELNEDPSRENNLLTIEAQDLPAGMYILQLQNGDRRASAKVVLTE